MWLKLKKIGFADCRSPQNKWSILEAFIMGSLHPSFLKPRSISADWASDQKFPSKRFIIPGLYKGWFKSFLLVISVISSELTSVKWGAARILQVSGGSAANWINLTDAGWRTGLPVESVVHLNAGDPGLALQVVAGIARKGHRVARLLPLAAAAAVHGRPRIPAGGRHRTCETRTVTSCAHFSLTGISPQEVAFPALKWGHMASALYNGSLGAPSKQNAI